MNSLSNYTRIIPYLYFLSSIIYWFTAVNQKEGIIAYPILLCSIPFIWQVLRPNKTLNLSLGITFMCLSSYLILAYITDLVQITQLSQFAKLSISFIGPFVILNFIMALWIIRNSLSRRY